MPTPPKPVIILRNENKSHRTKAELKQREIAEKSLSSGVCFKANKEVKKNKSALKEFRRIDKLFKNIDKNDALFENIINRYCMIFAECLDFQEKRETFYNDILNLEDDKESFANNDELSTFYNLKFKMHKSILDIDKQIQSKRKMLLDIEKENIMTVASALRSIPKKVDEQKEDPLLLALKGVKSG